MFKKAETLMEWIISPIGKKHLFFNLVCVTYKKEE